MAVVTLEEAKRYLRVDSGDEDGFISGLLETGESMCADMARMEAEELEGHLPMVRIAVLYVTAYLYEHREQADHEELVQTLRSLLFGIRREVFCWRSGAGAAAAGTAAVSRKKDRVEGG